MLKKPSVEVNNENILLLFNNCIDFENVLYKRINTSINTLQTTSKDYNGKLFSICTYMNTNKANNSILIVSKGLEFNQNVSVFFLRTLQINGKYVIRYLAYCLMSFTGHKCFSSV